MLTLQIIIAFLLFGLWCCYAVMEGWREAHYLHARIKSDNEISKDEGHKLHLLWWLQRSIVVMFLLYARIGLVCSWHDFFHLLAVLLSATLVFPFLHDGNMYATRNDLDPRNYPLRWLAQSDESTARSTDFWTPPKRIIGLFLGLTALITDVVMLF